MEHLLRLELSFDLVCYRQDFSGGKQKGKNSQTEIYPVLLQNLFASVDHRVSQNVLVEVQLMLISKEKSISIVNIPIFMISYNQQSQVWG